MKTYLVIAGVLVAGMLAASFSINLEGSKKNTLNASHGACPVVKQDAVPPVVLSAFQNKYPSDTVITWFIKDKTSYCAYFETKDFVDMRAQFSNAGAFIMEETDINDNGNFKDANGERPLDSTGCICEKVGMN